MQTELRKRTQSPRPVTVNKPALKKCVKCGEIKPLDAFSVQRGTPDNLKYQCKTCNEVERRAWRRRQLNKEHQISLDLALEAERMAKRARDSITAQQFRKIARSIRVRWAKNKRRANREILFAIEHKEARTLEEISDDVGLSKEATFDILTDLIRKGKIEEVFPPVKRNVQARRKFPLVYYVMKEKK